MTNKSYALDYEEPLLWEHRASDGCGVDLEALKGGQQELAFRPEQILVGQN